MALGQAVGSLRYLHFLARFCMPVSALSTRYLPLARMCLLVVAAVGVQLMQPGLWPVWIYMALCAAGATGLLAWWLHRHMPASVLLVCTALLAFGSTGWRASHYAARILPAHLQQRDIVVRGQIVGLPQWLPDGVRFAFAVEHATLDGQHVRLPDTLSLAWYLPRPARDKSPARQDASHGATPTTDTAMPAATYAALSSERTQGTAPASPPSTHRCSPCVQPGERWHMTVRLKQPHGSRNPFGFDYERWLWEQGLGATGYVRTGGRQPAPEKIGQAHPLDVRVWRDRARLHAREAVYQTLLPPPASATPASMQQAADMRLARLPGTRPASQADATERAAGIVAALLMGDQRAIAQSDWGIFRRTGVSHLLSISGLHITLFAWLASMLVGTLWRQSARMGWAAPCLWLPAPTAALWGGVALAALYAWFSGWGVPAQRTCIMLLCVAVLRSRGLAWPWWSVLATAAAAVLMIDPWALLQAGFWLSFVAVGVLFASASPVPAHTRANARPIQKLGQAALGFWRTQWAILLALTPLTLVLFGQVSLIGFVANALAVPLVTFVITPLALLGTAWPALWHAAAGLLQWLMVLLQQLAGMPWASYQVAIAPWWAGAVGLACGLALMLRLPWAWRLTAALGLLPVLLWQAPRPAHGHFDLIAADVGQGSAILVRTRTHSLLFDTGPQYSASSNAGERVLVPLLDALNEHPQWLLLSHQDGDHVGGAAAVLQARPHMQALGSIAADHPLQQISPVMPCVAGQVWQWDGVTFSILHPAAHDLANPALSSNAMSCVLHISNGQRSALLAGDIGTAQEQAIIARHAAKPAHTPLQADVLLVGHHGSKTSSSPAWLDAVQPRWAVVQQGYLNPYRHPHPTVMQRLHARRIAVRLSESCGAAWWQSKNGELQCEREQHRRYWQHRPVQQTLAAHAAPAAPLANSDTGTDVDAGVDTGAAAKSRP